MRPAQFSTTPIGNHRPAPVPHSRLALVAILAAIVAGCSNGPSNSVVTDAVTELVNRELTTLKGPNVVGELAKMGGYEGGEVRSVEKVGCETVSENIYDCTVVVETLVKCDPKSFIGMTTQCNTPNRTTSTYRFLKISKGWELQTDR